jgi:hypothetical protein
MSYPFGFSADFRPFYFRSVFVPIVLIGCAVFVAGRRDRGPPDWDLALFAIFLSTLPTFYYFDVVRERAIPAHWGLTDNFLAGVAALAMAAVMRSVANRSAAWSGLAAALSGLAILIKPSGALVAALLGLSWAVLAVSRQLPAYRTSKDYRRLAPGWLLWSGFWLAAADAAVFAAARRSSYLSAENFAYGAAAIAMMKQDIAMPWPVFVDIVHRGLGYWLPVWLAILVLIAAMSWPRLRGATTPLGLQPAPLVGCSLAIFAFGAWFWLLGSGGSMNVRYAVPFVLMACIASVPVFTRTLEGLRTRFRVMHALFLALPALNLGLLLIHPNPSVTWQDWTGVNVSVSKNDPVMNQAYSFIAKATASGRATIVYSMSTNATDAMFTAAADYARTIHPDAPPVSITGPVDWQRPAMFRFGEIDNADYILFEPMTDAAARRRIAERYDVPDFVSEQAVMQAWATELGSSDGVQTVSDSGIARVLQIVEPSLLEQSFQRVYASHRWRPEFFAGVPRRLSEAQFREELGPDAGKHLILRDTEFDSLLIVRGLRISRRGTQLAVQVWWQPLRDNVTADWVFFIHTIDEAGNILYADQISLARPERRRGSGEIYADVGTVPARGPGPLRLAVGFFRPGHALPLASRGERDWGGRRVIVSVPP